MAHEQKAGTLMELKGKREWRKKKTDKTSGGPARQIMGDLDGSSLIKMKNHL